jgi:hypothetical protein
LVRERQRTASLVADDRQQPDAYSGIFDGDDRAAAKRRFDVWPAFDELAEQRLGVRVAYSKNDDGRARFTGEREQMSVVQIVCDDYFGSRPCDGDNIWVLCALQSDVLGMPARVPGCGKTFMLSNSFTPPPRCGARCAPITQAA